MKLLTKVTSILLALSICPFTVFASAETMSTANVEQKISTKANEPIVKLLSAMGIIDDTFEFQYSKKISRAEFAMAVSKAGVYSIEGAEYKGIFEDVTEDNEAALYIEALQAAGVVSGEGGKFAPDRKITCNEAVVMLLRTAGYGQIADMSGGYPDGYMTVARNEGLLKSITSVSTITGDDMAVMIYNMLKLKAVGISSPGSIELDKTETILSQRHNIYYKKGIVISNSNTSLRADSGVKYGNILLDAGSELIEMSSGKTDIRTKLGYNVIAYYRYDEKSNSSECIYYEADSNNSVVSIDFKDLISYADGKIKFYESDLSTTKEIRTDNVAVIYNNVYYQGSFLNTDSFNGLVGTITAIENSGDNKYDIIAIEAYNTYVVNNAVSREQVFYDKITGQCVDLSVECTDSYELVFDNGKPAVFGDLCEDIVVSISKTSPEEKAKINRVIISTKKSSGAFTGVVSDDRDLEYIEIDGLNKYYMLNSVSKSALPNLGNGITLFLDVFNNVVYTTTKFLADMRYGFMVESKFRSVNDTVELTLYTAEGKLQKINLDEKVKIDGKRCKSTDDMRDVLSNLSVLKVGSDILPQGVLPIRYSLNEKGEISAIDTPDKGDTEDSHTLTFMRSETQVFSSGTFGYRTPVNGDTTFLLLKLLDKTDKSYYKMDSSYEFRGYNSSYPREKYRYNYCAFKIDPDSDYADYVLVFSSYGGHEKDDPCFVVDSYSARVYDEVNEQILVKLEGYAEGKKTDYFIAKEYEEEFLSLDLKAGDVIRCSTDINDYVCDVEGPILSYDKEAKKVHFDNIDEGSSDVGKIRQQEQSILALCGDVDVRREGLLKLYHIPWGASISANISRTVIQNDDNREVFYLSLDGTVPVIVFDAAENAEEKVYSGTYDDIISMENNFKKHSIILLRYRSDTLKEAIIYNNVYND